MQDLDSHAVKRPAMPRASARGMVALVLGLGLASGCDAPQSGVSTRLADSEAGVTRRVQAVRDWQAAPDQPGDALALTRTLWSDRQPRALRIAALQALAQQAPAALWRTAERGLTGVGDPAVVAAIAGRAADDQAQSMVGPLVRRWARPAGDPVFGPSPAVAADQRPEAQAVQRLTGQPAGAALQSVLHDDPSSANAAAAWTLLARGAWGFDAKRWAAQSQVDPPASPAGRVLARWAGVLDQWPINSEQVRGLLAWTQAPLPASPPAGLALRHLPLQAGAEISAKHSVPALVARLAQSTHVPRRIDRTHDASPGFVPEQLSAADAWALHTTLDTLAAPDTAARLFAQADADRVDPLTEHGGGLLRDAPAGGEFQAVDFSPERRLGDHAYVTPRALLEALYLRGLAHYHFHAQRHRHADYAGPGPGDLDFAAHSGLLCLTLTFVDRDHLNIDATLPHGVVIDLGCIRRPAGG